MPYRDKAKEKQWHKENHAHKLAYMKTYRRKNKAAVLASSAKCHRENKAKYDVSKRKYAEKNRQVIAVYKRNWSVENRERLNAKSSDNQKRRRETDENFKILGVLRCRLYSAVKKAGAKKAANTLALVGCDIQFLRGFIEARFLPGMTWKNYGKGKGKWAIDHHVPCAEFDLRDPGQQRQCFSYTNLRPLWEPDNQSKGCKLPPTHQAELI